VRYYHRFFFRASEISHWDNSGYLGSRGLLLPQSNGRKGLCLIVKFVNPSFGKFLTLSTHTPGQRVWFLVRKSLMIWCISFHVSERNRVNTMGAYMWVSTP